MQHSMAIRTYGAKVFYRIDEVFLPNVSYLMQVMNLDVGGPDAPIRIFEIEAADGTVVSVMRNALLTSQGASIIGLVRGGLRLALGV